MLYSVPRPRPTSVAAPKLMEFGALVGHAHRMVQRHLSDGRATRRRCVGVRRGWRRQERRHPGQRRRDSGRRWTGALRAKAGGVGKGAPHAVSRSITGEGAAELDEAIGGNRKLPNFIRFDGTRGPSLPYPCVSHMRDVKHTLGVPVKNGEEKYESRKKFQCDMRPSDALCTKWACQIGLATSSAIRNLPPPVTQRSRFARKRWWIRACAASRVGIGCCHDPTATSLHLLDRRNE